MVASILLQECSLCIHLVERGAEGGERVYQSQLMGECQTEGGNSCAAVMATCVYRVISVTFTVLLGTHSTAEAGRLKSYEDMVVLHARSFIRQIRKCGIADFPQA